MTTEEMFKKNIGLAYKIARKYLFNHSYEIEDIKQVALIGLWKAVLTFKNTHTFSAYAYTVISNEINLYLRKNKKREQEISINTKINDDELTIEDMLQDENNVGQALENTEIWILMKEVDFTKREKEVYDLLKKDYKQTQISKIHKRINEKIKKQMEMKEWI